MKSALIAGLLCLSLLSDVFGADGNPEKVALVKEEKLREARADWWGFNEADSTQALQSAIDSGVKKLVIPNMGKPWIVNPISLVSDQEIVLEPGTVIEAIKGGFKGKNDSLFYARGKKNIKITGCRDSVLRMHKKDYQDKEQYTPAEWRMGIALHSCENVTISGLSIMSSGGDGIYIGNGRTPMNYCKDIVIKDCVIDDHHRQGISVISVVNMLVENCVIKNTKGTAPQAGIDFEPNAKGERLFGIVMKNCVFEDNAGGAVIICTSPREDTEPISITFDNCKAVGTGFSGGFGPNPPLAKIDAKMMNCTQTVKGKTTVFNDFWTEFQNMQSLDPKQKEIIGRLKRIDVRNMKLKPLDATAYKELRKPKSMPLLRGKSNFILYASQGEEFKFTAKLLRDYKKGMVLSQISPSGKKSPIAKLSGKNAVENLSIDANETGTQIIEVDPGAGWFDIRTDRQGLAILALDGPVHLMGGLGLGTLYFYVPAGVAEFYVQAAGQGSERVKVSVYDGQGKLFEEKDALCVVHKFIVTRKDPSKGEIWSLKSEKSADFALEDFFIDLIGVPPIFAPDKKSLLIPAE